MRNISIFGLGYVGCVGIGCLAQQGHRMVGVDTDCTKVCFVNQGLPTIIEKDLEPILRRQHDAGLISATANVDEAVAATEVSFICVGTPSTPNGRLDLCAIVHVSEQIGAALRKKAAGRHVVAIRSTVPPGTGAMVREKIARISGRSPGRDFEVVSNPEFLREGSSVEDFVRPPFTLVGSPSEWAVDAMREVYEKIEAPFFAANPRLVELMKYACNSYHALKICFANELGNICKKLEIDSREFMEIFCRDTRLNISKAYLKPGFAYGGSCLPKDLRALRSIAHEHYLETPVIEGIERSNELQKQMVLDRILAAGKQNIGFLGLAFKAGTDDLRESPIVDVIERLLGKGFNILIYDPHVHLSRLTGANRDYIVKRIPFISRFVTDNLGMTVQASELLVVVNKSDGVEEYLAGHGHGKEIYDLRGLRGPARNGAGYSGIAW